MRRSQMWRGSAACLVAAGLMQGGCIEHRVKADPIEIKPIHITIDVNVRVDRELEDFFAFEEEVADKGDVR